MKDVKVNQNQESNEDKYKNGVVILQKGSEPYYIDLVPQNPRVGDKWESVDLYCTIAAKLRCDCWD